MAIGYINPQLVAALAAQAKQLPVPPQFASNVAPAGPNLPPPPGFDPNDPLAPAPDMAPPPQAPFMPPPQADSVNDGINSVGRPADAKDPAADGESQAKHDKALRKLMRQSKGEALMALGASLLSAPNFAQGMSQGISAYVRTLNEARVRNRPKHESVGDGGYERVIDPVTGETTYSRTPVADYNERKAQLVVDGKLGVANVNADAKRDVANITTEGAFKRTEFTWDKRESIADLDRTSRENIAEARNTTAVAVAKIRSQGGKPNASMEKQITDLNDDIVLINDSLSRTAPVMSAIQNGTLKFGPVNNLLNMGKNLTGIGADEESRAYAQYTTLRESLRGAYLMAFKGVQTEGDAQRAFDAIFPAQGDTEAVKSAISTVVRRVQEQLSIKQRRLSEIGDYRAPPQPESPATSTGVTWRVVN